MSDAHSSSEQERIRQLEAQVAAQQNQIAQLERIINDLRGEIGSLKSKLAGARKTSATSSKPPSSDIVKRTPPAPSASPRKIGRVAASNGLLGAKEQGRFCSLLLRAPNTVKEYLRREHDG